MRARSFLVSLVVTAASLLAQPAPDPSLIPAPYPAPPVTQDPPSENGYLKLGFDQLSSYVFTPPPFDPAADPSRLESKRAAMLRFAAQVIAR